MLILEFHVHFVDGISMYSVINVVSYETWGTVIWKTKGDVYSFVVNLWDVIVVFLCPFYEICPTNYFLSFFGFLVKEKEAPAPEIVEDEVEENKKRHLNVVFIGHVGKIAFLHVFC